MSHSDDPSDFNPNSLNATLARIIANQEAADHKSDKILAQVEKTNGRVTSLETWRTVVNAKVVVMGAVAGTIASAVGLVVKAYLDTH
jgi:hypothetical protein